MNLQYVKPEGAYFVFVNIKNIALPSNYPFPISITDKTRDYRVSWCLTQEYGVSSIPGSGKFSQLAIRPMLLLYEHCVAFYCKKDAHIGKNYLRLGVRKSDDALELAKSRLRKVKVLSPQCL